MISQMFQKIVVGMSIPAILMASAAVQGRNLKNPLKNKKALNKLKIPASDAAPIVEPAVNAADAAAAEAPTVQIEDKSAREVVNELAHKVGYLFHKAEAEEAEATGDGKIVELLQQILDQLKFDNELTQKMYKAFQEEEQAELDALEAENAAEEAEAAELAAEADAVPAAEEEKKESLRM